MRQRPTEPQTIKERRGKGGVACCLFVCMFVWGLGFIVLVCLVCLLVCLFVSFFAFVSFVH